MRDGAAGDITRRIPEIETRTSSTMEDAQAAGFYENTRKHAIFDSWQGQTVGAASFASVTGKFTFLSEPASSNDMPLISTVVNRSRVKKQFRENSGSAQTDDAGL